MKDRFKLGLVHVLTSVATSSQLHTCVSKASSPQGLDPRT
jgi:hypothetical protein